MICFSKIYSKKSFAQSLVEYSLILAFIAAILLLGLSGLGTNVKDLYNNSIVSPIKKSNKCIENPAFCGTDPPGGGKGSDKQIVD